MDPGNVEAIAARTWYHSDDNDLQLTTLEHLTSELETVDLDLVWLRGFVLEALGRDADARRAFDRSGEQKSSMRLYFRGLRAVEGFRGSPTEEKMRAGIRLFRHAIARSDHPRFHYHHSVLMSAAEIEDRQLMDSATADLEFHWPDSPATFEAIAQFYLSVDRDRGLRALRWLIENTTDAMPYCGLAMDAIARGEAEEALQIYDKGIEIDPDLPAIWLMRGQLHEQHNRTARARSDYLAAIVRNPSESYLYPVLEALHRKAKDLTTLREDLIAITTEHPTARPAWRMLARLCTELGLPKAAAAAQQQLSTLAPK